MKRFKIQSTFSTLYFDVEGFVLVSDTTEEEILKSLNEFVDDIDEGEDYFFSDCDNLDGTPDMDGYSIVELSEDEYNTLNKLFGESYGIFIGPDFE